jgi:hypothetical protein
MTLAGVAQEVSEQQRVPVTDEAMGLTAFKSHAAV